jgi:hypothetical protein
MFLLCSEGNRAAGARTIALTGPALGTGDIMNVKTKLGRAAGIAVAAMGMATLGLAGAASASTAQPAGNPTVGPQTCTIQTVNGHYLTAVGGGGRTTDVIHTDATRVGAWEKFTLIDSGDGSPVIHYGLRTSAGYYLTAVGGGGRTTDVIHSNATWLQGWEKFQFNSLGGGWYDIQTTDGHYVTAVGGGGYSSGDTLHTNATQVGAWEEFYLTCGL